MHTDGQSPTPPLFEVRDIHNAFVSKGLFAKARMDKYHAHDPAPSRIGEHRVRCHLYPEDVSKQEI
jgi:hypothetical protein